MDCRERGVFLVQLDPKVVGEALVDLDLRDLKGSKEKGVFKE